MARNRTNNEWLNDLRTGGAAQEAALVDLRELLLRATLFFFGRNLSDFGDLHRDEILQRAEDCAQDALMAVIGHLGDFRGDSKFSTWAYKFGVNMALMAARRERWKAVSLDELDSVDSGSMDRMLKDSSDVVGPEQSAMRAEVQSALRDVIENELTDKQRQVLSMMVFQEVPMDEVVRHLGTNRNAVYKLLHDARRKLKDGLQARGLDLHETLSVFSSQG